MRSEGTRGTRETRGTRGTRGPHDRREWGLGAKGDKGAEENLPTTNYQ
ncbi:hypothetical protein [Chroococcidiopsis cubana]|nr:hypothetical protein [Chroococcidiopsis cubana]